MDPKTALTEVKPIEFRVWRGQEWATNQTVAEYFEVSRQHLKDVIKANRSALTEHGLRVFGGKRDLKEALGLDPSVSRTTLWKPETVLFGASLVNSAVAEELSKIYVSDSA
ncbi:MAG: hypothetical protein ABEK59_11435 [Halobacteria archaeon]